MDLTHVYNRSVDPEGTDSLAKLSRLVRRGSTVLELGPATGYFTRFLTESLNCQVDCVEYSAEMAEHTRPVAREIWVGDLDELELGARIDPSTYDFVIAADVLEHLKNPWRVMDMCRPLLKPDGRFLISVPNVGHAALVAELLSGRFEYRDEGLLDRTHLRLFTRKSVLDMLQQSGYRPRSIDRVEWMAERTEFNRVLENCPPRLRDYLLAHPDSLTYQFIVDSEIGSLDDRAKRQLLENCHGPKDPYFVAKVYWGGPNELLDESRCHRQAVEIDKDKNIIQFDLPVGQSISQLRFDPADRSGYLDLFQIEILEVDQSGGLARPLISMNDPAAIRRGCRFVDLIFDESSNGPLHLSATDDPQVWLEPSAPIEPRTGCALRFKAEISWPKSADYLAVDEIVKSTTQQLMIEKRESRDLIDRLQCDLSVLKNELTGYTKRCDELELKASRLAEIEPQFEQTQATLSDIYRSRAWKCVTALRRIKRLIFRR